MSTATGLLIVLAVAILILLTFMAQRLMVKPIERMVREELRQSREDATRLAKELRDELAQTAKFSTDTLVRVVGELGSQQKGQLDGFGTLLREMRSSNEAHLADIRTTLELGSRELRTEVNAGLKANADSVVKTIGEMGRLQKSTLDEVTSQLRGLAETTQSRLDAVKATIDLRLKEMQESNDRKLDEMRKTVDEKLQTTLEKRLTESFKVVSGHLELVQRGLGEMQALASGVGDLKRVLTNVKARGTWAEVQLGAILEQVLTPAQYEKNVQTRDDSHDYVEYAVRLPGAGGDPASFVWLPIDSKFPQESYIRLLDAAQAADAEGVAEATAELARALRMCAQAVRDKYLAPPRTTDFAILFLPTEGLYAEVLRQQDLANELQQTYRVVVAGPTTLAALLSSLRLGFKTLAIEQRASEVWRVLSSVKTEFGKFGDVLTKVRKQLDRATRTIDATGARTRAMERRLRDVEELPPGVIAADILALPQTVIQIDEEELESHVDDANNEAH